MHFLNNNVLVYKINIKTLKMLQHVSISIQIILRELVVSSLKSQFKITKNIKGPLWQCGSIRLVCMYGAVQRTSPHRMLYSKTGFSLLIYIYFL